MVKTELSKHVYKVHKNKGRLIAIDLKFKGHSDVKIINIYIESNDSQKEECKETVKILTNWINQGKQEKKKIIVMGDFNANPEQWTKGKSTNTSVKYKILEILEKENFTNIQKVTNNTPLMHTWKSNDVK